MDDSEPSDRPAALAELATGLTELALPLELIGAAEARLARDELADQITGYLIPRLRRLDAPLLVALGGSTGAGKSSLTNALVGAEVAVPGVLRPTTRRPVLVCHPDDAAWFRGDAVLPDLERSEGDDTTAGPGLRIAEHPGIGPGLALLDAPDIDSVETANHELAALLLGAADLWLFVTSAVRYADAVPWRYLARAAERAVALALVVNRVPPGAAEEIGDDLAQLLSEQGLGRAPVFTVAEGQPGTGLAPEQVTELRAWLTESLATEAQRHAVVRSTVDGLIRSIPERVDQVLAAAHEQALVRGRLTRQATERWSVALDEVGEGLDSTVPVRAEILDQFREHLGTGQWMGRLQRGIGAVRDRVSGLFGRDDAPEAHIRQEVGSTIEDLVVRVADRSALAVIDGWEATPGGEELVADAPRGLDRAEAGLGKLVAADVRAWQESVLVLVAEQAGPRATLARGLSLGINGTGAALMLAVFSQTGGITGGEAAIAGGTAAASQAVLEAAFGDQTVRDLVRRARADLLERVEARFATQRARQLALLDPLPDADDIEQLRRLTAAVAR